MSDFVALKKHLPGTEIRWNEPIARYTTMGVGGPARAMVIAKKSQDIVRAVRAAGKIGLDYLIIGGGSNLVVADAGFSGLVIKNQAQGIRLLGSAGPKKLRRVKPRYRSFEPKKFYQFSDLDYEEEKKAVLVEAESGVRLAQLIGWCLAQGITGLQWFAGIPASAGGGIYMNLHGGTHFLGDLVQGAKLLTPEGRLKKVDQDYFEFGYDKSKIQKTREIVLSATFRLIRGEVDRARQTAVTWARRKSVQPQRSSGCIFQNLSPFQQRKLNLPTPSAGYLFDKVLKLKGKKVGQAVISPRHAAFIENLGGASAKDVLTLVEMMKRAAARKGLRLKTEVVIIA